MYFYTVLLRSSMFLKRTRSLMFFISISHVRYIYALIYRDKSVAPSYTRAVTHPDSILEKLWLDAE